MRKDAIPSYHIIRAGDLAASIVSEVTNIALQDNVCIQLNVTGAGADGEFTLETSNDYLPNQFNPKGPPVVAGSWVTVADSVVTIAGADLVIYDVTQLAPPYVRIRWTPNGGSAGAVDGYISSKAV
jgi:hypothetical protein